MIQVFDGDGVEPSMKSKIRGWRIAGLVQGHLFHVTVAPNGTYRLDEGHDAGDIWGYHDAAEEARNQVRQDFGDKIERLWLEPIRD